ncbi:GTPase/DUF3482 domain-containing protein [Poriferisphaera sp. WC338]|uniref:GTPase/DUF3482 domain-containing protein n=1 Tax=Poriferisphaera sp. WC338 TaxID=3425129 RepID=UPI003D816B2A
MNTNLPNLVVVGHPNQGKSSIVSTLIESTTPQISSFPGTTTTSTTYPININNQTILNLTDTPGFENPTALLHYLNQQQTSPHQTRQAFQNFIDTHKDHPDFQHEIQILTPILQPNAGILYIIDGSKPYSPQYNNEIEILRRTAAPRMAIINPIENANYIEDWQHALAQSFSTTRVFNAHHSEFNKHIELLQTFAAVHPDWKPQLESAANALQEQRQIRAAQSAKIIADTLSTALSASESKTIPQGEDPKPHQPEIQEELLTSIRQLETAAQHQLKDTYNLAALYTDKHNPITLPSELTHDLFSERTSIIFGLSRSQLLTVSAITGSSAGAIIGAKIDLLSGGSTFLAGSIIGAATGLTAGVATSILAEQNLANLSLPLQTSIKHNTRTLTAGPIAKSAPNFPFILTSRLLLFQKAVANHNHANRSPLKLGNTDNETNNTSPNSKSASTHPSSIITTSQSPPPTNSIESHTRPLAKIFTQLSKSPPAQKRNLLTNQLQSIILTVMSD